MNEVEMRCIQSLRRRLLSFWKMDASNVQLSEELQFHLERQTEANIANGMSPEEARLAAKASFGNLPTAVVALYLACRQDFVCFQ
jgi:hypothetical protein